MINKELENFIYEYTAYSKPIDKQTRILNELTPNKDIFSLLITDYSKIFEVDISELNLQECLTDNMITKLTVADLERGIMLGRLNESIINLKKDEQYLPIKFSWKDILIGIVLLIAISGILIFATFMLN